MQFSLGLSPFSGVRHCSLSMKCGLKSCSQPWQLGRADRGQRSCISQGLEFWNQFWGFFVQGKAMENHWENQPLIQQITEQNQPLIQQITELQIPVQRILRTYKRKKGKNQSGIKPHPPSAVQRNSHKTKCPFVVLFFMGKTPVLVYVCFILSQRSNSCFSFPLFKSPRSQHSNCPCSEPETCKMFLFFFFSPSY